MTDPLRVWQDGQFVDLERADVDVDADLETACEDWHGRCHRCGKAFSGGDAVYYRTQRFTARVGQPCTVQLKPFEAYHKRCVPPSLFHDAREFPHQWQFAAWPVACKCGAVFRSLDALSGDNRDACPSTRETAWHQIPDSSASAPRRPE